MIRWLTRLVSRRRRVELLEEDALLRQAEGDRAEAVEARAEARDLARWAKTVTDANRFALRLDTAFRQQAGRQP